MAIQLALRRYRNRVFEFSGTVLDNNGDEMLETIFVTIDTINHGNLELTVDKINKYFCPYWSKKISKCDKKITSRQIQLLPLLPLTVVTCTDHGLSRYPTELRSISNQEQKLKIRFHYDDI